MARLRTSDRKLNVVGNRIAELRKSMDLSQNELACLIQLQGWNVHKNAISKIEQGARAVSDMELILFARVLHTSIPNLLRDALNEKLDQSPMQ